MLGVIPYRGRQSKEIFEIEGITLGIITSGRKSESGQLSEPQKRVADEAGNGHLAEALVRKGALELVRDELGVAPLYYDIDQDETVYFASEVKALLAIKRNVTELYAGHRLVDNLQQQYYQLQRKEPLPDNAENLAQELRTRLIQSIKGVITDNPIGSWLSGGLDSSTIAALARPYCTEFHTFVAGLSGAKDLEYSREVASYIGSTHHEVILTLQDLIKALPEVIYHLESFDALLVRSSITNYLVAKAASDYVAEVFSGEGGDELFAGYEYLKSLSPEELDNELITITGNLHNTALQRVDRCSAAHGTTAHVVFADPNVFEFALKIPVIYKLYDGVEKWILRKAMTGLLPHRVLNRRKAKFWEGAGVNDVVSDYVEMKISDGDFTHERVLTNGWILKTKEELYYYRIFKEHFGEMHNLDWMGRSN